MTVEKLVELAELLGAGVVESRASSYVNFPRTHPLHAGFEPQEFLQEADAIFITRRHRALASGLEKT